MPTLFEKDFFALFNLSKKFDIDVAFLDEQYRRLAVEVHPDRFVSASDLEKRQALMISTHVNSAYQTLKQPLSRAKYILSLKGIDTQDESNTSMPPDFLMDQMAWHESIASARENHDIGELEKLSSDISCQFDCLREEFIENLDVSEDLPVAALVVRKWQFYARLDEQIGDAIETLLD